jgi:hypothetical protein
MTDWFFCPFISKAQFPQIERTDEGSGRQRCCLALLFVHGNYPKNSMAYHVRTELDALR